MNAIHGDLGPLFEHIARVSLQAAVLVAVVLVVQWVLRPWLAARWRHALWWVVIARLMLPIVPESPHSLYNWLPALPEARVESAPAPAAPAPERYALLPPARTPVERPAPAAAPPEARGLPAPPPPAAAEPAAPIPWLAWGWLLGVVAMAGALGLANARLTRLVRRGRVVDDARVLNLLEDCARRAGVPRRFTVMALDEGCTPALVGHVRPRLILSESLLATADDTALRHIFLHELAHWKRRDIPLNWLTALLLVVHWFNPALWYAWRRMRLDRELACDALALSWADPDEAGAYGRTILGLLDRGESMRALPGAVGIFESNAGLKRRIAMIARFTPNANRWSLLAVAVLALLAYGGLTDAQQQGQETEDASTELVDASLREKDRENLVLLGRVLAMYTPEQIGGFYPPLDEGCRLALSRAIHPEYLTDPSILVSPWVDMPADATAEDYFARSSYWYMPYVVTGNDSALKAIDTIREACDEGSELPSMVPESGMDGRLLREGVYRFFITDINDPDAGAKARARRKEVPILIGQPVAFSDGITGAHVLYKDGSVHLRQYTGPAPGEFPMNETVITALNSFQEAVKPLPAPDPRRVVRQGKPLTEAMDAPPEWVALKLNQSVSIQFDHEHLANITDFLQDHLKLNFVLDWRVIPRPDDHDARRATVPYITLRSVSFEAMLEALLRPMDLDYTFRDGYIWISTPKMLGMEGFEGRIGTTPGAPLAADSGTLPEALRPSADDQRRMTGQARSPDAAGDDLVDASLRAQDRQNLAYLGRVLRSYAPEQRGGAFPPLDGAGCRLTLSREAVYPEYLVEPDRLVSPWVDLPPDADVADYFERSSYWYMPYAVIEEATALMAIEFIQDACADGAELPLTIPEERTGGLYAIGLLRDGMERMFITDILDPDAEAKARAKVPVLIGQPVAFSNGLTGGHVLYMDGSVKFHPYPGEFPMTERVIEALMAFDPRGEEPHTQAPAPAEPAAAGGEALPEWAVEAFEQRVNLTGNAFTFDELVSEVADTTGVRIVLDPRVLDNRSMELLLQSNMTIIPLFGEHNIPLEAFLERELQRRGLGYAVKEDHIWVSTHDRLAVEPAELPEWAEETFEQRVTDTDTAFTFDEMISEIADTTGVRIVLDPRVLEDRGMESLLQAKITLPGTDNRTLEALLNLTMEFRNLDYVVKEDHIWVSMPDLLAEDGLRGHIASQYPTQAEMAASRLGGLPEWAAHAFEKRVEVSLEFHDVPEALEQLAEQFEVSIELDPRFNAEDPSLETNQRRRIFVSAQSYSLADLMALVLQRGSLDYAVKDGRFWVSKVEWLEQDGLTGLLGSDGDEQRHQYWSRRRGTGSSSFSQFSVPVADAYESTWNSLPAWARLALTTPIHETKHNIHILDMLAFLSEYTGADIMVDERVRPRLEAGREANTYSRSYQMMGITLQGVLQGLLDRAGLDFTVKDGHFIVSTPELLRDDGLEGLAQIPRQFPPSDPALPAQAGYQRWAGMALEMPASISASNEPLAEVLTRLSERLGGIPIRLDPRVEVEAAENDEGRITVRSVDLTDAPLDQVFRALLQPLHLDYAFTRSYIWVSSPEWLEQDGLTGELATPALLAAPGASTAEGGSSGPGSPSRSGFEARNLTVRGG